MSSDCASFDLYKEDGVPLTFIGSSNSSEHIVSRIKPQWARCIRIYPLGGTSVGLRMDVLGFRINPSSGERIRAFPTPLLHDGYASYFFFFLRKPYFIMQVLKPYL